MTVNWHLFFSNLFFRSKVVSLLLHGSLFLILILFFLIPDLRNLFFPNLFKYEKRVIQSAVRVDLVEMPVLTIEELKKLPDLEQKISPVVDKVVKTTVSEKIIEKSAEDSLDQLLNKVSKKDIKKDKNNKLEKKKAIKGSKELGDLILAGNKIAQGDDAQGDIRDQKNSEFDVYVLSVRRKVQQNWKLPSYLLDVNLRCLIQLRIDSRGQLISAKVINSSGNNDFDQRALDAIKIAGSFDIPGELIREELENGSLNLLFPF